MKACICCGSADLAKRGKYLRNRCQPCQNEYQRERYNANHAIYLATRKQLYAKHAEKRREESKARKAENRSRYSLLEWLRRNGIPAQDIPKDQLDSLVEMQEAVKRSKQVAKT